MKKSRKHRSNRSSPQFPIRVLYEDNHCLVVEKPAGMPVAGDSSGDPNLLDLAKEYLKKKYRKPGNVYLGLVHRLDRPVSGVVFLARTSKAAARLAEQFRSGSVQKVYLAWVEGVPEPPEGIVTDLIVKDSQRNVSRTVAAEEPGAKPGLLEYRLLKSTRSKSLLEIRPRTGRPHQIRVQLAALGTPIVGDVKYGARQTNSGRIALHAAELTFRHPVRDETITIRAAPPPDWIDTLLLVPQEVPDTN